MIKNLIFDVGNVLISYRWKDMIMEYGFDSDEAEKAGKEIFGAQFWCDEFDRGIATTQEICDRLCCLYPNHEDMFRWFFVHPERMPLPRFEVWNLMKSLKNRGYKLYCLSNYSKPLFDAHSSVGYWRGLLDGEMVSYMVNQCKPEPEIYESLLTKFDLKAEECIFFDDLPANVEQAVKMGFEGFVVNSEEELIEKLKEYDR